MKKICEYNTKISTTYEYIIMWDINRKEVRNIFDKIINGLVREENKKRKYGSFAKEDKYGEIKLWGKFGGIDNDTAKKYLNNFNKVLRANMRKSIKDLGYKPKAVHKIHKK